MGDTGPGRRRSVDVGGLALALSDQGRGHGWGGWDETENGETRYAEVLIDVRAHTETIVNQEPDQLPSFTALQEDTRARLIGSLGSWHFEPHKLPEEEVVACSYILFEALFRIEGMLDVVGVPLSRIAIFLQHLCQLYRQGNTYHNFQHALDVFQAIYYFLFSAGMVPSVSILLQSDARMWERNRENSDPLMSCLTNGDLFALYIAAVGHDVGHPGLTNAFMRNAKTPLSVVYDDKSVLEQMHYSLLLRTMRHHNLGFLLDRPHLGASFRQMLLGSVLATDMGVHYDFMAQFRNLINGADVCSLQRRVLVCQALIKCADISNPSRPYLVSQHWAAALESEWSSQLLLEKHLQLPASVKPSDSRLAEAGGQIWFITTFARPLFELVAEGVPRMEEFAHQCRENLALWEARCVELAAEANPPETTPGLPLAWPSQLPRDFLTAFPPALPESFRDDHLSSYYSASDARSFDSHSLSSGSSSSPTHYESCESSLPSPTLSPIDPPLNSLAALLPRLEITASLTASRPSSVASVSACSITHEATAAIRAAYKASVRKKKSFHRSSWNPSPATASTLAFAHSPLSPSPLAQSAGDAPMSPPSSASPSTATLSPSPLTPESAASHTRPVTLLQASCVSASTRYLYYAVPPRPFGPPVSFVPLLTAPPVSSPHAPLRFPGPRMRFDSMDSIACARRLALGHYVTASPMQSTTATTYIARPCRVVRRLLGFLVKIFRNILASLLTAPPVWWRREGRLLPIYTLNV
ncbi:3',5'-cyclic-nucleotide phosphodiesterase regA [Grifola frondosa]|uniref:Phosphodiesterase n=1 Tax=Grifola frondosa TaxID=5627 RepID=A0A1C7LU19_GRIFR|nr:3',5'-cyclic-nucleotide phosphodiesterase regA [Grifola frondosa]